LLHQFVLVWWAAWYSGRYSLVEERHRKVAEIKKLGFNTVSLPKVL
jgi:hypothetical protein